MQEPTGIKIQFDNTEAKWLYPEACIKFGQELDVILWFTLCTLSVSLKWVLICIKTF